MRDFFYRLIHFWIWWVLHAAFWLAAPFLFVFGVSGRTFDLLICVDQVMNVALRGRPDETISARAWRAHVALEWWGFVAVPILDFVFGRHHCFDAHMAELTRQHLHPSYGRTVPES